MLILQGDCLHHLAAMADGCVDAVVTDPPWNLGKRYGAHDDALPADRYADWLAATLEHCARVARGPVVILPGACNARLVPQLPRRAGLVLTARLTWRKPEPEPVLWMNARPAAGLPNTLWATEPPAEDPRFGLHPCPKPLALMQVLVAAATPAGGTVLDPFAGTGTTLVAAARCGRHAIGIELEPRYCDVARERTRRIVGAAVAAPTPPAFRG